MDPILLMLGAWWLRRELRKHPDVFERLLQPSNPSTIEFHQHLHVHESQGTDRR